MSSLRRAGIGFVTLLLAVGSLGLGARPASAAPGCTAGLAADFNGDGRSDAVVADPYATVNGQAEAGRIVVLYGDADGLVGEGSRGVITQGTDLVGGIADAGDHFGLALAVADLNCDERTDLVVGTPGEDINGQADSGYAQVIWGSPAGLGNGTDSVNYTQTNFGLAVHAGDQFGYAVDALANVGQGGAAAPYAYALAIGAPGVDIGSDTDAGWVGLRAPLDGGSVALTLTQDSPGVPGSTEPGDRFGAAVTLGYFLGGLSTVDVAVGSPNEDVGSISDAGTVTVYRDINDTAGGHVVYDQDSPGLASVPESGDRFGISLDSIRSGNTTRLAVGVPFEDLGSAASAGLVQLFSGTGSTLTAGAGLSQDTDGVANVAETGDLFGDSVAWVLPGPGTLLTRLAVSVPSEDGIANNTGMVQVFPLGDLGADVSYSQSSPGMPGTAQAGERFGSAMAVVRGALEQVLVVGVPDDVENSTGMVNVIPFGGGAPRTWIPGIGGIPSGGGARFGDAVGGSD